MITRKKPARRSVSKVVKDAMASTDMTLEEIVMVTSFLLLLKTGGRA